MNSARALFSLYLKYNGVQDKWFRLQGQVEQQATAEEVSSEDQQEPPQQTLYVAIQPGANMDTSQIEHSQPAVFVEVVEAGNGGEISSSGQVVQEEMVIDNSEFVIVWFGSGSCQEEWGKSIE